MGSHNKDPLARKKTLIIVACACLIASLAAGAKDFKKLERVDPEPYCSEADIIDCVHEIQIAMQSCSGAANILTCIEEQLSHVPHCILCLCDVLGSIIPGC